MLVSDLMWYAYRHNNGGIHVKRFFDERDTEEAEQSPFVWRVIGPFPAEDREAAILGAKNRFGMIDHITQ